MFQDGPGGKEAGEAGAHDAVRGASIVADLEEALNRSLRGRS
jgi:hypothetical protein